MAGVLERVIEALVLGRCQPCHHVLASGFRPRRFHDCGMGALSTVECFFPNTILNHLKTREWEVLLSRVGDRFMCDLLLQYTLFVQLRNGCYMQLTGKPMNELRTGSSLSEFATAATTADATDTAQDCLERERVFYCSSFSKIPGLPAQHLLSASSSRGNQEAVRRLVRHVFQRPRGNLSLRLMQVEPVFASILYRFRRFQFGRELERHCPILSSKQHWRVSLHTARRTDADSEQLRWHAHHDGYSSQDEGARCRSGLTNGPSNDDTLVAPQTTAPKLARFTRPRKSQMAHLHSATLAELLEMNTALVSVSSFLRAVCVGIFPARLWGSRHNRNHILRSLDRFVRLRRHESMTASQVRAGINIIVAA
jgi:hypothetical protein